MLPQQEMHEAIIRVFMQIRCIRRLCKNISSTKHTIVIKHHIRTIYELPVFTQSYK